MYDWVHDCIIQSSIVIPMGYVYKTLVINFMDE